MKKMPLTFLSISFILLSCGHSADELAAKEKAKQDSVFNDSMTTVLKKGARELDSVETRHKRINQLIQSGIPIEKADKYYDSIATVDKYY